MELNDFEKRIQQKMEELAIPPSESVWAHIDKRIPKKNRRKRIFFIVLFAALFLSMGYWIFNPWKKINDNEIVTKNISEVIAQKKDDSSFKFKQSINSKEDSLFKPGNSFHLLSHQKNLKNENRLVRSNRKAELSFQTTLLLNAQKEITYQKDFDKNFSEEKLLSQKNERSHLQRITDLFKNKILLFKKDENEIVQEITQEEMQNIAGTINPKRVGASVIESSDTIINQDQKRKLTFGFTLSAGQSYVANEIFDLTQSGSAYQYLSPGVGNSTGSRFFLPPVTKKSTAFLAGVFLEKNIALKSKISLGINYKHFSTINKTGNKIDSIQTAFTSTTYVNTYRNNFHYVELPVSLKFQLTNNNLLPVYWLVGFNISELINSNALQFTEKLNDDSGTIFPQTAYTDMSLSSSFSGTKNSGSPIGKGGSMARFTIVDKRLYTVSNSDLNVFNITIPNDPVYNKKVNLGTWNIETIFPFKDKLFIGSQNGMFVYNISNADEPFLIGKFSHVQSCDPVIADDNYAYVTLRTGSICFGNTNQLEILQLNSYTNPTLSRAYSFTNPHGLSKDGDLLFICDGADGLKIYNAATVINLKLIKQFTGLETYDVIAYNHIALVVAKDGLYQYDYSDANNIHLISKIGISNK